MLFYKGYREHLHDFVISNGNYDDYIRRHSPWAVPAILATGEETKRRLTRLEAGALSDNEENEVQKYYTFNQTGNIMISSTVPDEKDMNDDVRTLFKKCAVFFTAVTAALNKKEKTLYDYDAVEKIVSGSGLFVNLRREDRTFNYSSTKISLNSAVIAGVLGGVAAGTGALVVAQQIINQMGSQIEIAIEKQEATKKIAHLLFVCENLMGMPFVTASLFYIEAQEGRFVQTSNCNSVVHSTINFKYHQDTFMFVDPEYINQFTPDFQENPEFQALIDRLATSIGE